METIPDLWRLMDPNGNQIEIDIPANDGFFLQKLHIYCPMGNITK